MVEKLMVLLCIGAIAVVGYLVARELVLISKNAKKGITNVAETSKTNPLLEHELHPWDRPYLEWWMKD